MRPVVTFSPSWNKILSGDSITMTCDVDDAVEGSVTYTWYKNNGWIHIGKTFTIQSAITRHSGDYQCGTSEDNISEAVTLNVTKGAVILQSPPYIYEGDDLSLRCHSRSRDTQGPIEFYRNNEIIHSSNNDSEIQFRNHRDETAVYKCTRQVLTADYSVYSDETDVTAQDSKPDLVEHHQGEWQRECPRPPTTNPPPLGNSTRRGPKGGGSSYAGLTSRGTRRSAGYAATSPPRTVDYFFSIRITFTPNSRKIFTGESMTMTCNVNHYKSYSWYKDNKLLKQTDQNFIVIRSAQRSDSGRYQCRTSFGNSPEVRLDVSDGPVILQAPLYVYDRYTPYLRCHSRPEYSVDWTRFYKDDKLLQDSGDEWLYLRGEDMAGRYRCEKRLLVYISVSHTDLVSVPIRDLFSSPEINLTPSVTTEGDNLTRSVTTEGDHLTRSVTTEGDHLTRSVTTEGDSLTRSVTTEGDSLTLTCDTRLSPHRRTTELQYAFYRDGQEVQGFSPSNKYEVMSAKLEDSGNYSCTVRTLDDRVWKTSQELHVQIQNEGRENRNLMQINIIRLIVSGLIVIMGCAILSHHLYEVCRSQEGREEN